MDFPSRPDRWLGFGMVSLGLGLALNTILGPLVLGLITYPFTLTVYYETLGLEAVTLALIAPLAVAAGILVLRGHRAGAALALGPAGYAVYMLLQYVVGPQYATYQPSIAFHLVLFVIGAWLLLRSWSVVKVQSLPAVSRGWAAVTFLLAAFVVSRWLPAFAGMTNSTPVPAAGPDLTMFWSIFMLDMGMIVPATIATGVALLRRDRWAVKGLFGIIGWFALVPPSVAAMSIVKLVNADPLASAADTIVFVIVTLIFWSLFAWLFRRLFDEDQSRSVDGVISAAAAAPSVRPKPRSRTAPGYIEGL